MTPRAVHRFLARSGQKERQRPSSPHRVGLSPVMGAEGRTHSGFLLGRENFWGATLPWVCECETPS